jgi:glycosyltransferase involved in cell wall biosynthesis
MTRLAVLLHGSIQNDYRVLKTIKTLSEKCIIDVYSITESNSKLTPTNKNINYHPIPKKNLLKHIILRHTFFCHEYNYLSKKANNSVEPYDYVWANDLPTLLPAFKIAKKSKAKVIYDSHEIYTETINQFFPSNLIGVKGFISKILIQFMRWHGKKVERRQLPIVHRFITVNESLLNYFNKRNKIKSGSIIMNLPVFTSTKVKFSKVDFKKKYNWSEKTVVSLYQGTLNEGRGLRLIIKSFVELDDKFCLVIIGGGPLKNELIDLSNTLNLQQRVKFIDFVNLTDLPSYTAGADIGINLLEDFNLSKKMASPNKLFEYIHAGIPVISTNSLESKKVMEKFHVGVLVINTSESILNGIHEITESNNLLKNSYQFALAAEYYCWENQEHTLKNLLD